MTASTTLLPVLTLLAGLLLGNAIGRISAQAAHVDQGAPNGIHRESGNRLPVISRDNLDEFGKFEYDEIQEDIRTGRMLAGLFGPVGIRLYSPSVSDGTLRSNMYLRFDSGIGRRTYELAVLVTARELNQQFEWTAHERAALNAGVDQAVIDVVKFRRPVTTVAARDALVIQLGREAFRNRAVGLNTFNETLNVFGAKNLVDIVSVFGEYSSMAVLLNVFDQRLRDSQAPLLPVQ